jgi:hypothetical protein
MFGKKEDKDLIANISRLAEIVSRNIEAIERLEKRLDRLEVFASVGKIEPKVKKEGEFTSTISGFESDEDFDKLNGILNAITEKDDSFTFDSDKEKMEVYLHCATKDEAMKKSMWLWSKTGIENIKFNVK